ncbi:MAG: CAP domain-containing protein [Ruminococcus sp.]|nr:CAP domain-containing protein [Ruminococcus sp.]
MKKLLSIIFALSMCMTVMTISVTTASAETVSDITDTQELDKSDEKVESEDPTTDKVVSDETEEDPENDVVSEEYNEILDAVEKYKTNQKGVQCISADYNVSYEALNDKYIFVEIASKETDCNAQKVVKRSSDVVWLQNLDATEFVVYADGNIYTAGELYKHYEITFDEFKKAGGAYYGDINGNDVVDVSDVTQLQLILAGLTAKVADMSEIFYDVNFDEYVDISDATKIQMYLAGYEDNFADEHKLVKLNYIEATCVSKGYSGDSYCEECKRVVKMGTETDENVKNHKNTEIRNAKKPTAESEGYTGDVCCVDCDALISAGKPIERNLNEAEKKEIGKAILAQLNEEREAEGLDPVKWDDDIFSAVDIRAQEFTDWCHGDNVNRGAHDRPSGKKWYDILTETYALSGEILAASNIIDDLVPMWMGSEVHRGVILTDDYTHATVGIVKVTEDNGIVMYYACAIFRAEIIK